MSQSILIVEDDPRIVDLIAKNLESVGYECHRSPDGGTALADFARLRPALVVLDLGLPGLDGLEVARRIRKDSDVPILMVTARSSETDKLLGLEIGADDYVTKPFGIKELMARVKRLVERPNAGGGALAPTLYKFGDVEVRFEPREVYKAGTVVALSFKEFELLKYLIEHRGRTVSREELLEEIWGVDEELGVTTRTVDTHVSNLRSKLGAGFAQPFIVAVHKVGYKFVEPAA